MPSQPDPIAGSRRLRKVSAIEPVCRLLMESTGRPRGARCDAWDRSRKLAWAWVCDGHAWRATADVRPAPWAAAERARAERQRLGLHFAHSGLPEVDLEND